MSTSFSPPLKLAGFAAVLVVVLAGSFGVARAVSPDALAGRSSGSSAEGANRGRGAAQMSAMGVATLPGLAGDQDGYRFVPEASTLTSGPMQPFRFRLLGPDSRPVTRFDQLQERALHLIVVRRDLTGFQHVHPTQEADGAWMVTLELRTAGTWRAFADFMPAAGPGELTLGVDFQVGGLFEVGTGPAAARPADPRLDATFNRRGDDVEVAVRRDGIPIEPEPYLGARGHLVALRTGDLAYVQGQPQKGGGPGVRFRASLPPSGTYALYFDYQVDGSVHTGTTTLKVA